MIPVKNDLESIIANNISWTKEYTQSAMLDLLKNPVIKSEKGLTLLMDCIQTFSNYFQKTVMLRATLTTDLKFSFSAQQHLDEEYGHHLLIASLRKNQPPHWDPILEATSAWFSWKMLTSDNIEKTLLVHMVLESSAVVFFKAAYEILKEHDCAQYFSIHMENDPAHELMGTDLLKNLREDEYKNLLIIQNQGWEMMIAAGNRIADIVTNGVTTNKQDI